MKLAPPQRFADPAPALGRGLSLLRLLGNGEAWTLDAIARRVEIPKSSAFRLLETLRRHGCVRGGTREGYSALCELRPIGDDTEVLRRRLETGMDGLLQATGETVEWWEPCPSGMVLQRQIGPEEGEVLVRARPGFLRRWGEELDAVARLAYAFANPAPHLAETFLYYAEDGVGGILSREEAAALISTARRIGTATDLIFNSNGVRRAAAPVFAGGALHGVLSVAEIFRFGAKPDRRAHTKALARAARTLSV